ncbi:MAG: hypothetical protein ACRBFS_23850 [Aureispira sp.]
MQTPFLTFIQELRFETVHLSYQWHNVTTEEQQQVSAYLQHHYRQEALNYPHQTPDFDAAAANWAALLLYYAAQAILNRQATLEDIASLFTTYTGAKTPSSVLSVDLSLRFLPSLLDKLKAINPDDGLILLLEQQLEEWPYSAIGYPIQQLPQQKLDDPCLLQLYADRIIAKKDTRLLIVPRLLETVRASLGAHQQKIWPDLDFFTTAASSS